MGYNLFSFHDVAVSMLDIDVFNLLDSLAKTIRKKNKHFGGIQVIAVGDFLQLPPVQLGRGSLLQRQFCFEGSAWREAGLNSREGMIILTEPLRQRDDDFISILNSLRVGDSSSHLMGLLDKCVVSKKPLPQDGIIPTKLYCTNKDVDKENQERLAEIVEDVISIKATDDWSRLETKSAAVKKFLLDQAEKSAPTQIDLKIGAQVGSQPYWLS